MHVVQVFRTRTEPHTFAGFNHAQIVQICIVCTDHPSFKRSIICIWTALTIRAETLAIIKWEQRSQELDWDLHMSCMHFHSLPSARVILSGLFVILKIRLVSSVWQEWSERARHTVWRCRHRVRTRIPRAFKCWWPPSSARWFSVSSSTSLCASMVCALATHQIWTNSYCAHHRLRSYAWWLLTCILQVMCIEPSAGCFTCKRSFPPLAYKAPISWWSLIETKEQISGGDNFFGTMRKKICPWRLWQSV